MLIDVAFAAALAAAAPAGDAPLYTTPYFQSLGIAAGLPSSRIYKTLQDRDGYLWIGTHDGLARYDGVGFRVFRHDPNDAATLGGDIISTLFVDRDNRVWCGTEESGLSVLDATRGKFIHYAHDEHDPASLGGNDVWAITQDASGAIWVGGYSAGIDRLVPGATGFVHYRHDAADPHSIAADTVLGLMTARDGRVWVGSEAGIDVIDVNGSLRHVDLSALADPRRINANSMLDAGDGTVLAATRLGLLRIDAELHASIVADDRLSDRIVNSVVAGSEPGDLWIATRHGLDHLAPGGMISAYLENAAVAGAFPGENAYDAMRDREGTLWFATFEAGVVKLPASWHNFALFRNDPTDTASLSANRTQGLAADDAGRIWSVNLDGGIDRLDPATGRVERFGGGRLAAPDKALWSVLADRSGQLWVGYTRGLRVYELQSGKFIDIPVAATRADALAPGLMNHIVQDPAGAIWVSAFDSSGAVHRIDQVSHRLERFDAKTAALRDAEVNQLGFDANGALLVASGAGLDRFGVAARRFAPVPGAPTQRVYAFAFADDGTLWLHVLGALEHYRVNGDALVLVERIDAERGWPALTVGGLQVDSTGAVWVSSARGLWRYDPRTRAVRVFDHRDGLASSEFNRLPMVRRADGAMFAGTLAGIVGFLPQRIVENATPPPVVLDAIVVRRHDRDETIDPGIGELDVRWDDRDLRISARALSFANPAANRYQWQLDGFDSGWIDTGNRGEREFSQLPAGDYDLQLRAAGLAAVWSKPIQPLRLHVAAPPWATPLAFAVYALALLAALRWAFRAYRLRIKRRYAFALAEQQRRFAEQSNAAKTEFLATMGHEIRTPMTGVLGMAELLLRTPLDATQSGYAQTILNSGRMMLRLVNDSLDLARIEAGKLELEEAPFDLRALLAEISSVAQPMARSKSLEWVCNTGTDIAPCLRGDAVRIKQVLLNLVNNAIKFTEHGGVTLDARRAPDGGVLFVISDTGPGIAESTRARLFQRFEQADGAQRYGGSGLGLAICRELVARMGGSIELDSQTGRGSTFRVQLPLAEASEEEMRARARTAPEEVASVRRLDQGGTPRRILLVEDDATVAEVITGLLQMQGHRVVHVAQGLAALTEFEAGQHDLALIDLDLPGVDGLALARMLRTREAQSGKVRMPLIGISARSAGNEEALCLAAGMDAFLRKPLTGAVLARALGAATPD
jgi:signal transduction histidine kinase/CheY-like chemotaxis protein/streptogramin lyase